jgi:hypothetical protein
MERRRPHPQLGGHLPEGPTPSSQLASTDDVDMLWGSAESGSLSPGAFEADLRALDQSSALLFRGPRKHRDQEGSHRAARIQPSLPRADDRHADSVEFEDVLEVTDETPAEAVDRPHPQDGEVATFRVLHHLLVRGPVLHGAGLLFVGVCDGVSTRPDELLDLGTLVLDGLRAVRFADAEVDGSALAHDPNTNEGVSDQSRPTEWRSSGHPDPPKTESTIVTHFSPRTGDLAV